MEGMTAVKKKVLVQRPDIQKVDTVEKLNNRKKVFAKKWKVTEEGAAQDSESEIKR